MFTFTVTPFQIALVLGLVLMALPIFNFARQGVGIAHVDPWLIKSARGLSRSVATLFQRLRGLFSTRSIGYAAAAALAALAIHLGVVHVDAMTLLVGGSVLGEVAPTLTEVKTALDESNKAFHGQLLAINKEIADLKAAGKAVDPLLLESQKKIGDAMDKFSEVNEKFMAHEARMNRIEKMGGNLPENEKLEVKTEMFNRTIRSMAASQGNSAPPAVTVEQYKAYEKAFDRYTRVGEKNLTPEESRAMSVGSDLAGGFLVTPDLTGRIVERVYETSDVRKFASVQLISTDALEGSADLDEASGGWVSELGTRIDSNTPNAPTPWKIPVHEMYSQPKAAQKLVNDANVDIQAWLLKKVGGKLSRLQNTAFVTGSGVGKPRGFASYTTSAVADGTRAWGTPEHVLTGTSASFGTDPNAIQKLNTLMGKLKDHFVPGAAFYGNRTTKFAIRNLTDASAAGKFVFIPSFQAGVPDQVLGAFFRVLQDMADIAANSLSLAYGDMGQYYQIVDRQGLSLLVDPFTSKPYVIYYTTARVGGDVIDFEAMKFLKFA